MQSLLPSEPFLGGELVEVARPIAKGAWEAARPEDLPALLRRALRTALTPPRGPVVLSIPVDVQGAPAPTAHRRVAIDAPAPPPDAALDRAAALLASARAPVVLAGDAVAHAGASDAEALAEPSSSVGLRSHARPSGVSASPMRTPTSSATVMPLMPLFTKHAPGRRKT